MKTQLNAYLSFKGEAKAAMTFYQSIFGGKLEIMKYSESGYPGDVDPDAIMHSSLTVSDTFAVMASDNPPGAEHKAGNNFAMCVSGDDAETLRSYWQRLSQDGTVWMPLEKQTWGDEFGQCVDQFGIGWMVNISSPQQG